MLPGERLPLEGFDPMEAYLAEGRSIGGLSGSPVFVRQTVNTSIPNQKGEKIPFAGIGQIYFLGLVHGHWDLPKSFEKTPHSEAVNMGISVIVPAHKIWEVVNHPELAEQRRLNDEAVAKK